MDTLQVFKDLGLPVAALVFIGYGSWLCVGWIARELVVPLRDRHFSFLGSIEKAIEAISKAQENLVLQQTNIVEDLERISGLIKCPPPCQQEKVAK